MCVCVYGCIYACCVSRLHRDSANVFHLLFSFRLCVFFSFLCFYFKKYTHFTYYGSLYVCIHVSLCVIIHDVECGRFSHDFFTIIFQFIQHIPQTILIQFSLLFIYTKFGFVQNIKNKTKQLDSFFFVFIYVFCQCFFFHDLQFHNRCK